VLCKAHKVGEEELYLKIADVKIKNQITPATIAYLAGLLWLVFGECKQCK